MYVPAPHPGPANARPHPARPGRITQLAAAHGIQIMPSPHK
jgi:hypothetical protein